VFRFVPRFAHSLIPLHLRQLADRFLRIKNKNY